MLRFILAIFSSFQHSTYVLTVSCSHYHAAARSMPVFFFIDPEIINDGQLARVNNITLSYTFFQTDLDDDDDDEDDDDAEDDAVEDKIDGSTADDMAVINNGGEAGRGWTKKLAFWRR